MQQQDSVWCSPGDRDEIPEVNSGPAALSYACNEDEGMALHQHVRALFTGHCRIVCTRL